MNHGRGMSVEGDIFGEKAQLVHRVVSRLYFVGENTLVSNCHLQIQMSHWHLSSWFLKAQYG